LLGSSISNEPFLKVAIFLTVILLTVRVPVLSVHMTDAAPRDSTAGNFLTMAFRLAIFWTPTAIARVTTIGNPSGIAATAREIPISTISPTAS